MHFRFTCYWTLYWNVKWRKFNTKITLGSLKLHIKWGKTLNCWILNLSSTVFQCLSSEMLLCSWCCLEFWSKQWAAGMQLHRSIWWNALYRWAGVLITVPSWRPAVSKLSYRSITHGSAVRNSIWNWPVIHKSTEQNSWESDSHSA
jgi:hypothetical protein